MADAAVGTTAVRPAKKKRAGRTGGVRSVGRGRHITGLLLFAPTLAVVAIFVYFFIAFSVRVSVSAAYTPLNPDLTTTPNLLDNYGQLMSEQRFQADLRNIIIFTVLLLVLATAGGLFLAVLVHNTARAAGFFRSVYLLPYALSFIVTGVVWRWIFTPQTGVNLLLEYSGISGLYEQATGQPLQPDWITSPDVVGDLNSVIAGIWPDAADFIQVQLGIPVALIPVIIAATWQLAGFAMAMFLAGLGSVPDEVLEAAKVDGANAWQTFWRVTFPLLRPTMVIVLVLLGHIALRSFDLVYSMVGSGPGFATDVPGIYVYDQMFRALNYNMGAAASIVMLVLVAAIVVPYLWKTYAKEES